MERTMDGNPESAGSRARKAAWILLLLAACGEERETGVPPSAVSDSAILADTTRRDKVDLEGGRTGS